MKTISNVYKLVLGLVLMLSACNDKLNIEPVDQADAQQVLKTSEDVEALLVGAYGAGGGLGSGDLYGGNLLRNAELLGTSTEVLWGGTFAEPRQIYRKQILVNNADVAEAWLDSYFTINICNTVLANLNLVEEDIRDRVEGEAKFIRGTLYFELVRLFGRQWGDGDANQNLAVPLIITPTVNFSSIDLAPRNTVAQVYTQALTDLTEAEAKLPASNGIFASKAAAAGILSRLHLQQNRFAEAANAANRVIASGRYQLVPIDFVFDTRIAQNGNNTAETVFAVQVSNQDGVNNLNTFYGASSVGGRGDIAVQEAHFNLYEQDDLRATLFYEDPGTGDIRTSKFVNQYGNIQVLRLAEMVLTRAEANFRANTAVGNAPIDDVNIIRARAGLAPLADSQLTLAAILRERRLELAFEGTLIHDVKRARQNIGSIAWNSPRLVFPIPQREIDANRALIQNQGY